MKLLKKQLLAILLGIGLIITLLPASAMAYVGAKWETGGAQEFYTDGTRFVMENDYIYFSVFDTAPDGLELKAKNDTSAGHSGITLEFFIEYPGQEKREMNIESATLKTDGAQNNGMVTAVFTFGNDHYQTPGDVEMTYTVDYKLVRLDEGSTGNGTVTEPIMKVGDDAGTTWALFADGEFEFEGEALPVFAGDEHAEVSVRASLLWFSNFGHPEYDGKVPVAPVMISKADRDYNKESPVTTDYNTTNISQGLNWTATHPDENDSEYHITEVFVDSYAYANPFVATSQFYNYFVDTAFEDNRQGVSGFEDVLFPTDIYYERDDDFGSNYAYSCLVVETSTQFHEPNDPQTADLLIGYRDLINTQEEQLPTNPDKITISSSADRLAIYANGTVTPYDGSGDISGDPVAIIRGDFELSNGAYNFTGGAAALSPTVTATWGNDGYFRITTSGQVQQRGVHLNAPTFKFYLPKAGSEDALSLGFNADGLTMSKMDNNDAVINIDIPRTSTKIESGTATVDGDLTFEGELSFNNMFSQQPLDMTDLSYALNQGDFTVNGVKAEGKFGSVGLLGFTLGDVSGSIDTFKDTYDFTANINVFSLLEAKGELQLKRTDSGELMPNNLYFEVDSSIGIPLVPPAPVVKLTGGGAGFYGLADTANGDWYAIPPLKFRGSVDAKIVEFLEADGANIVLGPSEFELSVDALKIAGTNFASFSGGIGMYLGGDKMTYNGTDYSGLSASGRMWLDIDLPSQRLNFLVFDGELAAGIFGGMNGNNLYLKGYGNSTAYAELQFPDSWPLVGGWNLFGVGVDTAVSAETLIQGSSDYAGTINSAFENLDLQVGLAATGSFLGSDVRVWVILPDVAQSSREDWNWGWDFKFWGSLGRWDWNGTAMNIPSNASAAPMLMSASADDAPVLMSNDSNSTASKEITISNVGEDDTAYLVLSFTEDTGIDLSKVSVTKANDGDGKFTFSPVPIEVDDSNTITNSDNANIMSGVMPLAEGQGTGNEQVLIIKIGEGSVANGTYTVSLGDNDDEIQPEFSTANVVTPADGLGSQIEASSGADSCTVKCSVVNPEDNATYIVRTYLGTEFNGMDYLLDEQVLSKSEYDEFSIKSSVKGTAAPTGQYYLTICLMKEVTYTDGDESGQVGYIAIDSKGSSLQLDYTNTNAPATAPTTVELQAAGNETMIASWSEVSDAEGYKITIYNADGTDTGLGYEYDATQFDSKNTDYISGLSYNAGTYSIDMAMTVGGELDADKDYKVGISAYNSATVTIGDETQNVKYYGPEKLSDKAYLPEYEPLEMTIQYKATGADLVTLKADSETGIYYLSVRQGSNTSLGLIRLDDDKKASYTVTRMDNNDQIYVDTYDEFDIPDFEGVLMLSVTGSVKDEDTGITDTTTRYVLISRDDVAPIVTLENDTFYADDNGNYTITGITEPGATIEVGGSSTEADENGEFSFTSTLPNDLTSMLVTVTATDAAGNSGTGSALITTIPDGTGDPDDPEPSDPDTGGKTTYSPTITDTENGTVSVSPSRPTRGQTVTITAEPDDGYVVDKVTVTDRNGNQVSVTDNGDGTYRFTQPSSVVTIEVTFRAAGSVADCPGDETCPMAQFTDLNMDLWYHDGIHYCLENGLMNGVGNALFAPNGTITRAQIVTIIYRLEGEPAVTDGSAFTDVADGTWYTDAVAWAAANEIMGGYGNGLFGPNDPITREQFAATLYRYAQYKGYDVSISENTNIQSFADFDAISEYAITAMQWTFDKGIITGISATTLEPQGIATRAQAAAMLQRFCENVVQ